MLKAIMLLPFFVADLGHRVKPRQVAQCQGRMTVGHGPGVLRGGGAKAKGKAKAAPQGKCFAGDSWCRVFGQVM